jgi:hypothetical protein
LKNTWVKAGCSGVSEAGRTDTSSNATPLVSSRRGAFGSARCLNVVGGLLSWIASHRCALADFDEHVVERYLRHRAGRQTIQRGDRAALKRWLVVLREEGAIAPVVLPPLTPHDRIFKEFDVYLRTERGLARRSIARHLPIIRQFLREVCPAGEADLGKIGQETVIRYIERHAQDWSPNTGRRSGAEGSRLLRPGDCGGTA